PSVRSAPTDSRHHSRLSSQYLPRFSSQPQVPPRLSSRDHLGFDQRHYLACRAGSHCFRTLPASAAPVPLCLRQLPPALRRQLRVVGQQPQHRLQLLPVHVQARVIDAAPPSTQQPSPRPASTTPAPPLPPL